MLRLKIGGVWHHKPPHIFDDFMSIRVMTQNVMEQVSDTSNVSDTCFFATTSCVITHKINMFDLYVGSGDGFVKRFLIQDASETDKIIFTLRLRQGCVGTMIRQ